jgi:hypothetical protein
MSGIRRWECWKNPSSDKSLFGFLMMDNIVRNPNRKCGVCHRLFKHFPAASLRARAKPGCESTPVIFATPLASFARHIFVCALSLPAMSRVNIHQKTFDFLREIVRFVTIYFLTQKGRLQRTQLQVI